MKVINIAKVENTPRETRLFNGTVYTQSFVDETMSKRFRIQQVNFDKGIRNKFHKHTVEQILIVTEGKGIVATEQEEITVTPGDIIFIPAGEVHWHGATKDSNFSHLYVMSPESETTQVED
jgi:quercetin dioxygenase-like cupin family protein